MMASRVGEKIIQDAICGVRWHARRVLKSRTRAGSEGPQGTLLGDALGERADETIPPPRKPPRAVPAPGLLDNGVPLDRDRVHPSLQTPGLLIRHMQRFV